MIRIHKACPELKTGSLKKVDADYNVIGYGRFNGRASTLVLVNNNDHEVTRRLSVWYLDIPKECILDVLSEVDFKKLLNIKEKSAGPR